MSLDVYLRIPGYKQPRLDQRIFIREDGQNKEISRAEWDARFPGQEPVAAVIDDGDEVYSANITHNLVEMAQEAGIYYPLWRPEEINIRWARQLVTPLQHGLWVLKGDPTRFKQFNPKNGWGTYESLVKFVEAYLSACEQYPEAEVSVSR